MKIERQTYEINCNDRRLILATVEAYQQFTKREQVLALPYNGNKKTFFQYLDTLEKSERFTDIIIYSQNLKLMYQELKSLCKLVPAAGGVIKNKHQKILVMYRRQHWDLPKGKIDPEETFKEAAIRECMEETGLTDLVLEKKIGSTHHIFRDRNNIRCFKKTKWFSMSNLGTDKVIPQTEEDIEKIEWMTLEEALNLKPIYKNIVTILKKL
ncbi:MAG: NUDIX domain-containing protein [Bacteroidota bacterium]|nr:NUDIX domain-containing protein [Bacteroidota bacterium]